MMFMEDRLFYNRMFMGGRLVYMKLMGSRLVYNRMFIGGRLVYVC